MAQRARIHGRQFRNGWKRMLKLFNNWFDIFNSKFRKYERLYEYSVNIDYQNNILDDVTSTIKDMRVGKIKTSLLPLQKGILLSNVSLKNHFEDLKQKFSAGDRPVIYLITNRLNQDVIENLFGYIRAMRGINNILTPLDFHYRLR